MNIKHSRQYENEEAIKMGIAYEVPMRVSVRVSNVVNAEKVKEAYDILDQHFAICQYRKDEKGNDAVPYGKHDIHFWCSCKNDDSRDLFYTHLTFNQKTSKEDRFKLLDSLTFALGNLFNGIDGEAIVEYHHEWDYQKVNEIAENRFKELEGEKCVCNSLDSIIIIGGKPTVGRLIRFRDAYAFKPLRSKKYVYPRTAKDVCFAVKAA